MSEKIQTMFSEIAPTYDKANHLLSMNQDVQWRKDSVKQMREGGFKPTKVLDLCAGTGDFAQAVKEQVPDAQVFMADFSKPMLLLAKEKVKTQQGFGLLAADALKLPFQDMTFDAVVCGFGVRNLDSPEAGLKEIARVLKPGGKTVVLEFFKPVNPLLRLIYALYISVIVPFLGGAVSKNKAAYTYLPDSARKFASAGEFKDLMEKCGFRDVSLESRTLGIAHSFIGIRK
jgi:demethylmenaquinone methyltransferase / 2-methoxy-6-polyprenyl-1,4-benzoquinol methylase